MPGSKEAKTEAKTLGIDPAAAHQQTLKRGKIYFLFVDQGGGGARA